MELIQSGPRALSLRRIVNGADLPWVVFSNSLLTDKHLWSAQISALGRRYNIALYDQHGHGKSPVVQDRMVMEDFADDLLAVVRATGDRPVHYVGVSMGVPTGLLAYAKAPKAFAKLVLVNGQVTAPPEARALWEGRIEQARLDFNGFCEETMRRWLGPIAAQGLLGQALLQMMEATSFDGFACGARALGKFDASAGIAALAVPVLAVAGRNDGPLALHMSETFGALDGVRFEVIGDAGHLPSYEQPVVFNQLLSEFLHG